MWIWIWILHIVSTTFIILFILFSQFYFNVFPSHTHTHYHILFPFICVPFSFSFLCKKSFTKYVGTVIYSHTFHEIKIHGLNVIKFIKNITHKHKQHQQQPFQNIVCRMTFLFCYFRWMIHYIQPHLSSITYVSFSFARSLSLSLSLSKQLALYVYLPAPSVIQTKIILF